MASGPRWATYSLVACDLEAREWGVAVQSKFPAVGAVVPWAAPEVGAVATQALANVSYGPQGLELLREGLSAEETIARVTEADEEREHRQVGVVDAHGGAATYTGSACLEWAGGVTGDGYAAQGNILVSEETVDALAQTYESTAGQPLAERLLEALAAAQLAGGDRRGQQSAALLVVKRDSGYGASSDVLVDLRVDDHTAPIEELRRLYGIHDLLFGRTPEEEWLTVDDALAGELRERLAGLGYGQDSLEEAFTTWAGVENLEERVRGADRIDPVVLAELRKRG
ncbi:MAG TPA: DUF1028 domain-containing protein [Gaiellaceae bacterium]|nr:DUF1028 domain-containing protein [Gaiellaceae bacterium]